MCGKMAAGTESDKKMKKKKERKITLVMQQTHKSLLNRTNRFQHVQTKKV